MDKVLSVLYLLLNCAGIVFAIALLFWVVYQLSTVHFEEHVYKDPPAPTVLTLEGFGATFLGGRDNNEDAFLLKDSLFVVADGMGGHEAGEIASKYVVDTFDQVDDERAARPQAQPGDTLESEDQWFHQSRIAAHRVMREDAQQHPRRQGMGATVVAAKRQGEQLLYGWAGDSRLYRLRSGSLEQLTVDDSLPQMLFERGLIGKDEVENHPKKNVITKNLGPKDDASGARVGKSELVDGDGYLLCSDGLSDCATADEIKQCLEAGDTAEDKAKALIDLAERKKARDNTTVIVVLVRQS